MVNTALRYHLTVPARINILGNPSDAVEGDFATISAAVDLFAEALVEPADSLILEISSKSALLPWDASLDQEQETEYDLERAQYLEVQDPGIPLPYTGELDLLKGAINRLYDFSPEFRHKFNSSKVRITAWSEVPRQSGLGGSSLFVILTLAGLREFYDLDRRLHNDYTLAELTQRVEGEELGIACGFADRYVPIFGGIAYLDYRGKLYHKEIYQEPLTTYERLDSWVTDLPIVAITTGVQHNSGDVHGRMRPIYLEEFDAWAKRGSDPPPMVRFMQGAWETAWQGKIALLEGNLEIFGELMNTNHRLVDEMMTYCGFSDGAGWANNLFVQTALESGALGAKLTGAGGGGSVYALTKIGEENKLIQIWQKTAEEAGLTTSSIFRPKISCQGLVVRRIE
jgi:galactokinase/mevalonate kinase-like predicted kinase